MDRRLAIGGAALGVFLAVATAWWLSPDTGGRLAQPLPPVEAPERAELPPSPSPAPSAPAVARRPDPAPAPSRPPPGSLTKEVAPRPPADLDRVYDVEQRGIASALFDRYPRLVTCYEEHSASYGPVAGRPIVRATVLPEPNEEGSRLEISIENRGTALDQLDLCLTDSMADATFGDVDIPTSVLQPIPIPASR